MSILHRLVVATFALSTPLPAQITLGNKPPTPAEQQQPRHPETWAELLAGDAIRLRQIAPAPHELQSCSQRVTTPDSLFVTTGAATHLQIWTQAARGGSWEPIMIDNAKPDTLLVRVLNLDCRSLHPIALVVATDKHFLRLNSSAFLGEQSTIDDFEKASVFIKGEGGRREVAKLVAPKCDTCSYRVASDQARFDSLSQRIALARSRFEAKRAAEIAGEPLRVAAAIKARDAEEARQVKAAKDREAHIRSRKWPAVVKKAIFAGEIRFGMTREQVRLSWGEPDDINRTVTPGRVSEQWVYGKQYVYFENGIVTAWQD